jgi:hypothetical protein
MSVSTILLILLGVFNLQQRYYWWDIKIFDYVEASEILLSFGEILMIIFFYITAIGLLFTTILTWIAGNAAAEKTGTVVTLWETIEELDPTKLGCTLTLIAFVASMAWFFLPIMYFRNISNAAEWNVLWFDGLYLLVVIAGLMLAYTTENKKQDSDSLLMQMLFSGFISLIIFFYCRNYFTFSLRQNGLAKYEVALTFEDGSMLLTTKRRIYIDQSKNFIFFREVDTQQNLIIPLNDVRRIEMKLLHKGL